MKRDCRNLFGFRLCSTLRRREVPGNAAIRPGEQVAVLVVNPPQFQDRGHMLIDPEVPEPVVATPVSPAFTDDEQGGTLLAPAIPPGGLSRIQSRQNKQLRYSGYLWGPTRKRCEPLTCVRFAPIIRTALAASLRLSLLRSQRRFGC